MLFCDIFFQVRQITEIIKQKNEDFGEIKKKRKRI